MKLLLIICSTIFLFCMCNEEIEIRSVVRTMNEKSALNIRNLNSCFLDYDLNNSKANNIKIIKFENKVYTYITYKDIHVLQSDSILIQDGSQQSFIDGNFYDSYIKLWNNIFYPTYSLDYQETTNNDYEEYSIKDSSDNYLISIQFKKNENGVSGLVGRLINNLDGLERKYTLSQNDTLVYFYSDPSSCYKISKYILKKNKYIPESGTFNNDNKERSYRLNEFTYDDSTFVKNKLDSLLSHIKIKK